MRLLTVQAYFFLTLVSTGAPAADQDEYGAVHTIAVVSAIGDTLEFTVTTRIFGGRLDPLNISSWGIDPWLRQEISRALASRFVVRDFTFDTGTLAACSGYQNCVDALPKSTAVDAYVLAYRAAEPDPIGRTSDIAGLGLYHHPGILGLSDINSAYAIYGVAVVDAKTGKVIDHGTARMPEEHFLGEHNPPIERISGSLWPESPREMTKHRNPKYERSCCD